MLRVRGGSPLAPCACAYRRWIFFESLERRLEPHQFKCPRGKILTWTSVAFLLAPYRPHMSSTVQMFSFFPSLDWHGFAETFAPSGLEWISAAWSSRRCLDRLWVRDLSNSPEQGNVQTRAHTQIKKCNFFSAQAKCHALFPSAKSTCIANTMDESHGRFGLTPGFRPVFFLERLSPRHFGRSFSNRGILNGLFQVSLSWRLGARWFGEPQSHKATN